MPRAITHGVLPSVPLADQPFPTISNANLPLAGNVAHQNLQDLILAGATGNLLQQSNRSNTQGILTTHVWPKSRMLFAVVSKMSKEGVLNAKQRGVLKDLILDYDSRLV